ncbi:hypothetical protein FN846DRAFT_85738 [Sphaerosporella brunnea]|uniref:Uncharacterized protein n=1 Tax=Sphaerosporella brunnea TaxID=1250544 RepID=A0A5J5EUG5_9PEZI|nr:hypothetical protein FN846DRAFT_85738 [Sphaerosporella brunnea]
MCLFSTLPCIASDGLGVHAAGKVQWGYVRMKMQLLEHQEHSLLAMSNAPDLQQAPPQQHEHYPSPALLLQHFATNKPHEFYPPSPPIPHCPPPQIRLQPPSPPFDNYYTPVTDAVRAEYARRYLPNPPSSTFTVDFTAELSLPGWPGITMIFYPTGSVHITCGGRSVGMFTAAKSMPTLHQKLGVAITKAPSVTQTVRGEGEFEYLCVGGRVAELVPREVEILPDPEEVQRVRERVREAGGMCMKIVDREMEMGRVTAQKRAGGKSPAAKGRVDTQGAVVKRRVTGVRKRPLSKKAEETLLESVEAATVVESEVEQ